MKSDVNFQKIILEFFKLNGRVPYNDNDTLYQKWKRSNEKFILKYMKDKDLSKIPEEYREFIRKMREYGYGFEEENIQEKILEYIDKNGKLPSFSQKDGKELYKKWLKSDEKKILKIYEGENIEKVPEKYQGFVKKMREKGYGIEAKKIGDEILEFVEDKKRMPSSSKKTEKGLYIKWFKSNEKRALEIFYGRPIEDVPEKYREFVEKMRNYGLEKNCKIRSKADQKIQKEILEFIARNGIMPHDGKSSVLYQKWERSNERFMLENMKDKELSEIPEEYREFIKKMREYGYGIDKSMQKEILEFIEKNGKLPNSKEGNGKDLYQRWWQSNEKFILDNYEEKAIEEIPKKYRDFIKKMREKGYGVEKKSFEEEIFEFIEERKRIPISASEEKEKVLYRKWLNSDERKAWTIFDGKPIEDVPENYRNFVKKMREYQDIYKHNKANSQSSTLTDSDEEFEEIEQFYKNEKDDNKYQDLKKLSVEELDKYINDIENEQKEKERKIKRMKKIKKLKELMKLSQEQDKEISELKRQINEEKNNISNTYDRS